MLFLSASYISNKLISATARQRYERASLSAYAGKVFAREVHSIEAYRGVCSSSGLVKPGLLPSASLSQLKGNE